MGQRITQRIYECSLCGVTPEDGENLWEMGFQVWCERCCDEAENNPDEFNKKYGEEQE